LLNEETRQGLKSLTTVGNAAIVRYPWTSVLHKNKSLIAFINMEEYGEEPFEEFGLESMSEFLSLVDFYKDPEIEIENGVISIESGKFHQKYGTSDLDTMKSYDVKVTTLEKVSATPEVIAFEITADELQRFKKIASLTKATSMLVSGSEDSTITICKLDRNNNMSDESITEYPMSVSKDINVVFDIQNIAKLPDKNYSVSIKQSETSGNGISVWEVSDEPIKIVMSVANLF
jgi:hypothetical protein